MGAAKVSSSKRGTLPIKIKQLLRSGVPTTPSSLPGFWDGSGVPVAGQVPTFLAEAPFAELFFLIFDMELKKAGGSSVPRDKHANPQPTSSQTASQTAYQPQANPKPIDTRSHVHEHLMQSQKPGRGISIGELGKHLKTKASLKTKDPYCVLGGLETKAKTKPAQSQISQPTRKTAGSKPEVTGRLL